jgi:hypothetical protein
MHYIVAHFESLPKIFLTKILRYIVVIWRERTKTFLSFEKDY